LATFVLIHGAFIGGWAWRWVASDLRVAGHEVCDPSLTGHGERVHLARPEIDLETHIEDVVNVLHYEDLRDVVLVGWSYGGMLAAGAADRAPQRIGHVVYLDADVPRDGDTSGFPPDRNTERAERARAYGDGWRVPLQGEFDAVLGELPTQMRDWIVERLTPQLLATWTHPIRLTGAGEAIPTTYIRCTIGYDPANEDTQRQDARIRNAPAWRYRELAASHFAPWTAPRAVADLLLEAV
jgi:pimeloyl-ACP methyl ester carboxylesterase